MTDPCHDLFDAAAWETRIRCDISVQDPVLCNLRVTLAHYDFYRLNDPGIMRAELMEAVHDPATATIIEWSEIVADVFLKTHFA